MYRISLEVLKDILEDIREHPIRNCLITSTRENHEFELQIEGEYLTKVCFRNYAKADDYVSDAIPKTIDMPYIFLDQFRYDALEGNGWYFVIGYEPEKRHQAYLNLSNKIIELDKRIQKYVNPASINLIFDLEEECLCVP